MGICFQYFVRINNDAMNALVYVPYVHVIEFWYSLSSVGKCLEVDLLIRVTKPPQLQLELQSFSNFVNLTWVNGLSLFYVEFAELFLGIVFHELLIQLFCPFHLYVISPF